MVTGTESTQTYFGLGIRSSCSCLGAEVCFGASGHAVRSFVTFMIWWEPLHLEM